MQCTSICIVGMEGEELIITRHLNRAYRTANGPGSGAPPLPSSSSSSSCKDEPVTPSARSTSTPNTLVHGIPSVQHPAGSTTPTHMLQAPSSHLTPQSVSGASPRPSKLTGNSSLSSPLMHSSANASAKDDPLDMNGGPKTPTSNMAPPLSSMLQMTNSLQSANSPYNPSNSSSTSVGLKAPSLSLNHGGNGPPLTSPTLAHMSKSMDQLPPPNHMSLPPHQQHLMQFQVRASQTLNSEYQCSFYHLEHESASSYAWSTGLHAIPLQSTPWWQSPTSTTTTRASSHV